MYVKMPGLGFQDIPVSGELIAADSGERIPRMRAVIVRANDPGWLLSINPGKVRSSINPTLTSTW